MLRNSIVVDASSLTVNLCLHHVRCRCLVLQCCRFPADRCGRRCKCRGVCLGALRFSLVTLDPLFSNLPGIPEKSEFAKKTFFFCLAGPRTRSPRRCGVEIRRPEGHGAPLLKALFFCVTASAINPLITFGDFCCKMALPSL